MIKKRGCLLFGSVARTSQPLRRKGSEIILLKLLLLGSKGLWTCPGHGGRGYLQRSMLYLFLGVSVAFSVMQPPVTVTQTWLWSCFLFVLGPADVCFSVQCPLFEGIVVVYSTLKCKTSSSPPLNPAKYTFISLSPMLKICKGKVVKL